MRALPTRAFGVFPGNISVYQSMRDTLRKIHFLPHVHSHPPELYSDEGMKEESPLNQVKFFISFFLSPICPIMTGILCVCVRVSSVYTPVSRLKNMLKSCIVIITLHLQALYIADFFYLYCSQLRLSSFHYLQPVLCLPTATNQNPCMGNYTMSIRAFD